jgi:hypothetical protein
MCTLPVVMLGTGEEGPVPTQRNGLINGLQKFI